MSLLVTSCIGPIVLWAAPKSPDMTMSRQPPEEKSNSPWSPGRTPELILQAARNPLAAVYSHGRRWIAPGQAALWNDYRHHSIKGNLSGRSRTAKHRIRAQPHGSEGANIPRTGQTTYNIGTLVPNIGHRGPKETSPPPRISRGAILRAYDKMTAKKSRGSICLLRKPARR